MSEDALRLIPLGGLGEIGRNMMVLEYGESMIVIDAGLMFPENDMLGIDIVLPDFTYVREHADRVRAVIITHGHEDHVGALPYLLDKVKAPVYATRLTRGLIEVKLRHSIVKEVLMIWQRVLRNWVISQRLRRSLTSGHPTSRIGKKKARERIVCAFSLSLSRSKEEEAYI